MSNPLFKQLCDRSLLKKAWHLARIDERSKFIQDMFAYNDFAFDLDRHIELLCLYLKEGTYHPQKLLRIDVPKSTYSVRPGSSIDIRDLIVLYAITILIAPKLDKLLPDNVYSYRLNANKKHKSLFKEKDIIEYTFLKKGTIKRRIDIFNPWYEQWPIFLQKSIYSYEKDNYTYLALSDIAAYFENIHLDILRELLFKYFPKDQRIINLLISILEHWTWPTKHFLTIRRGIPQGNSISSFLGNIYLLPLDQAFNEFAKKYKINYFRYMDDVKIFTKKRETAIKAIFKMNEVLRELQLNVQGAKTAIKEKDEIANELFDERFNKINPYIEELRKGKLIRERRDEIINLLRTEGDELDYQKHLKGHDLRLFRRLMTGFTMLEDDHLIDAALYQLKINPDERLTRSALTYFSIFPTLAKISNDILIFLESSANLFDYQEAWLLKILRESYRNRLKIRNYAKKVYYNKKKHWYVRCQAVNILADTVIRPKSFDRVIKMYNEEDDIEVKRTTLKLICQFDPKKQREILMDCAYNPHYKMATLGKMLLSLRYNNEIAKQELAFIFRDCGEKKLRDNFYKLGVIRFINDKQIRERLTEYLTKIEFPIHSKYLKLKYKAILQQISYRQMKLDFD
jgi:hypothetical protein